jgi:hypothetical protein
MQWTKSAQHLGLGLLALGMTAKTAWAADSGVNAGQDEPYGSERGLSIGGDAGYYTYGMDDVNNRFRDGGGNDISGGMGYGGSVKLGLTDRLAAKIGMDYLFASRASSRTVGGTTYNTQVNLPATMLFIGGEYAILPLSIVNLKLIGGYTLVSVYNGDERSSDGSNQDFGAVTGSGSGFQAGLGLEVFLNRGFSLEGDLAYDHARIDNATFAGSSADPGSTNKNGSVDYSGLVAKVALNIYLFR